jgi:alternate signal-mediated exported protein
MDNCPEIYIKERFFMKNNANNNKPKTARQKKVLVASILLAGLITVGGTFAWFGASDEVSNRLTATANYGVVLSEDFTSTDNWTPGQTINKDVYSVNTGNVPAFLKVSLQNVFSVVAPGKPLTVESKIETPSSADTNGVITRTFSDTPATDTSVTKVELTDAERESIEAGGRLVYPYTYKKYTYTEDDTNTGVAYQEILSTFFNEGTKTEATNTVTDRSGTTTYIYKYTPNEAEKIENGVETIKTKGKIEVIEYSTCKLINDDSTDAVADWKPTESGVYVFERSDGENKLSNVALDDAKKYTGYYYDKSANKYYALSSIAITRSTTDNTISALTTTLKTQTTLTTASTGSDFKVEFVKTGTEYVKKAGESDVFAKDTPYLTAQVSFKKPADAGKDSIGTTTIKVYIALASDYATYWTINDESTDNPKLSNLAFYYNGILEGGETSKKLVDKILLDPDAGKNSEFISFDYDLDVILNSIQAVVNESGVYDISSVTSDTNGTWKMTPKISGDTKVVSWSAKT